MALNIKRELKQKESFINGDRNCLLASFYPYTSLENRWPGGKVDVIEKTTLETLKDFYRQYHASRAKLIIVGDINPLPVENWVKDIFGKFDGSQVPMALTLPTPGPLSDRHFLLKYYDVIKSSYLFFAYKFRKIDWLNPINMQQYVEFRLFCNLLNQRFRGMEYNETNVMSLSFNKNIKRLSFFGDQIMGWEIQLSDDKVRDLFHRLLLEIKRIQLHGFHESEFHAARKKLMSTYKYRLKKVQDNKITHHQVVSLYQRHVNRKLPTKDSYYQEYLKRLELADRILCFAEWQGAVPPL
jgi:predicted Zn-dependent peptidase